MSFLDALRRKRPYQTPGFAGGYLDDQLQLEPTQTAALDQPQQPIAPDQQTRPRTVSPFIDRLNQGQTRPRIADPTTFDAAHLRELESKPSGFRDKLGLVSQNIATNLGYKPLPTRGQRDEAVVAGRLSRDVALDTEKTRRMGVQSQMAAREAAITAGQERVRQGDERLAGQQDALKQRETQNYHNNLIKEYNGQTDFDPEDPKNGDFVAEWQRAFGRKPMKNVRGSQFAVIQGYRPDGSPMVTIFNKGTGVGTEGTGALPATTEGQANRQQRAQQFNTAEQGRNQRSANQIGARQGRQGGMKQSEVNAANKMIASYNYIRKQELSTDTPKDENGKEIKRATLQRQKEALREQIFGNYPDMVEADQQDLIHMKQGAPQAAPNARGVPQGGSFDMAGWMKAHPQASEAQKNAQRAKARARNLAIIE